MNKKEMVAKIGEAYRKLDNMDDLKELANRLDNIQDELSVVADQVQEVYKILEEMPDDESEIEE